MKKLLLVASLCTALFSQSLRFESDTVGFSLNNQYPIKTALSNLSDEAVNVDSITIGSISNAMTMTETCLANYDGEIGLSDLFLEMYFGSGSFSKAQGKLTSSFETASIPAYGSVPFQVSLCQNVLEWQRNELLSRTVYFNLDLTAHFSNGDSASVTVKGIWIADEEADNE